MKGKDRAAQSPDERSIGPNKSRWLEMTRGMFEVSRSIQEVLRDDKALGGLSGVLANWGDAEHLHEYG